MKGSAILQESASLTYFPFANSRFSFGANGYLIADKNVKKNFYAKSFTASAQPFSKAQISFNYLINESINLNEENGYIVNNTSDLTSSRYSVTADFSLSKNISLYFLLMRENKIETQKKINYYYNSAIIGLKIIP